jgi:hypothetical protein
MTWRSLLTTLSMATVFTMTAALADPDDITDDNEP